MHTDDFEHQPGQLPVNKIAIHDQPPYEKALDGTNFEQYPISLTHDEKEGHRLARTIGLLGNPIIKATLSLLG